ncbi:hypothetical protein [Marinoscillum sp. MHG1-6]|uniref:hypothetical protein n=1 Tax=Marinoscillum sp. MHG1-6 TaxID=2959627 RepID=UPI002157A7F6|nr:hypothetical protein [Marinoscillum sp. MHG1-6]
MPFSFVRRGLGSVFFCLRGPGHAKENEVYPLIGIPNNQVLNDCFQVKYNYPTTLLLDPNFFPSFIKRDVFAGIDNAISQSELPSFKVFWGIESFAEMRFKYNMERSKNIQILRSN